MIRIITVAPCLSHTALVREIVTGLHRHGGAVIYGDSRASTADRACRAIRKAVFRRFNALGARTEWSIGKGPGGFVMVLRSHPPGPLNWGRIR